MDSPLWAQAIPLSLTVIVLGILIAVLHLALSILNLLPVATPIFLKIRWVDVAVGMTIYLKTSIDFAILMGRLMASYPGWRGRIAIEIGTAVGNAVGTISIIALWVVFKDVHMLLAIMILIAALVLLELAYESLEQFSGWEGTGGIKRVLYLSLHKLLCRVNRITAPFLSWIMPDLGEAMRGRSGLSWRGLLTFSISVPFILGLDDFAGYVPLFSVVNVYGFAIGVFAAHTLLNIALFLSPSRTIAAVRNEYVSFLGALAFIGLAAYGIFEAGKIFLSVL